MTIPRSLCRSLSLTNCSDLSSSLLTPIMILLLPPIEKGRSRNYELEIVCDFRGLRFEERKIGFVSSFIRFRFSDRKIKKTSTKLNSWLMYWCVIKHKGVVIFIVIVEP